MCLGTILKEVNRAFGEGNTKMGIPNLNDLCFFSFFTVLTEKVYDSYHGLILKLRGQRL